MSHLQLISVNSTSFIPFSNSYTSNATITIPAGASYANIQTYSAGGLGAEGSAITVGDPYFDGNGAFVQDWSVCNGSNGSSGLQVWSNNNLVTSGGSITITFESNGSVTFSSAISYSVNSGSDGVLSCFDTTALFGVTPAFTSGANGSPASGNVTIYWR